jgi:hypothetical protein
MFVALRKQGGRGASSLWGMVITLILPKNRLKKFSLIFGANVTKCEFF